MNIGTIVFGGAAGDFTSPRTMAVNFGSADDRALIVEVMNTGGSAGSVLSVVIDPTGANITMTAETEIGPSPNVGNVGYLRRFRAAGASMPTGVKNVVITVAAGSSIINARAIPMDGVTAIAAGVSSATTGSTFSVTVPSAAGRAVLMSSVTMGVSDVRVFTAQSPATLVKRIFSSDHYYMHGIIVQTAGAASVTPVATASAATSVETTGWDLTLSAPVAPTLGTPSAQTGVTGTAFSWTGSTLAALTSGGTGPFTYAVATGTLPVGLSLNASTGVVSGTPTTAGSGAVTFRVTDSLSAVATSGSVTFTVTAPAATSTTLTGPSGGQVGVASSNFTVGADGLITGTITVTPSDSGGGGAFTPTSVAISAGTPTATFTYTPGSAGAKTISISDDGGLTDAASVTYSAALVLGRLLFTANPADVCREFGSGSAITGGSATMWIHNATTGLLVAQKSVTTDGSGLFGTVSDGAMALSTNYRVDFKFASGEYGVVYKSTEAT